MEAQRTGVCHAGRSSKCVGIAFKCDSARFGEGGRLEVTVQPASLLLRKQREWAGSL